MKSHNRKSMIRHFVLIVLALAALALVSANQVWAQASAKTDGAGRPILISGPIDESKLVRLSGNTRPEANAKNDRGPVEDGFPMDHMFLQLKRSPELEQALERFMDEQLDKKSPNFRHWLMPAELGEKYGLADSDIETIKAWLQSHGFTVGYVYPTRMVMDISGTAGQIREAFHTEIHYLDVKGERQFANMSDPQIPEALAPAVVGLVKLHSFQPHRFAMPRTNYSIGGGDYILVPADFQTIYNLSPLYRAGIYGQSQTIVVVEDTNSYGSDFTTFQTTFGLSGYGGSLTTVHPNAGSNCTNPGTNADDGEADLDVEAAISIAPGATVELASCSDGSGNQNFGGLIAIENLVSAPSPPAVISMSYGECEATNLATANAAFSSAFQSAAAAGVSVFASSGDAGSASCSPNATSSTTGIGVTGWGESPYNVSVGGTDFEDAYNAGKPANGGLPQSTYWSPGNGGTYGSAKSYIPEVPWNDSCAGYLLYNYAGASAAYGATGYCNSGGTAYQTTGAGGGGPSGCFAGAPGTSNIVSGTCTGIPKPSWQSVVGNPADGVRDVPDVSLFASNGIWGHYMAVCWTDPSQTSGGATANCTGAPSSWSGFGGTSIASPMMAAIQALVDQKWGIRAGLPTPTYYSIARSEFGSGSTADPTCYSVNQPPRRGQASSCVFYDVTQGDIVVNTSGTHVNSYLPAGTDGVQSTQTLTGVTVLTAGSGYSSAPTCTIGAPSNLNSYLSPTNTTLWAGGTQATCTANINTFASGTLTVAAAGASGWAGTVTFVVGSTTYSFVTTAPTVANQVEVYTGSSGTTNETRNAENMEAVINANSSQCYTSGCVYSGQTANSAATATESTNVLTLTARVSGTVGNFTLTGYTTDITVGGGLGSNGGTGGTTVLSISLPSTGQGYNGGGGCILSGGGGSGATCVPIISATTLAPAYQPAYGATPGWDFATGLGSVNAYNLVFNSAW